MLRHSTAHVMAQAVTQLFPGATYSIGPAIENGFYYDFELPGGAHVLRRRPRPPSRPGCARSSPPTSRSCAPRCRPTRRCELFADQPYKVEIIERVQAAAAGGGGDVLDAGEADTGGTIRVYRNTPSLRRPVPGPARAVDRPPRALPPAEGGRRLLARQREGPDAAAHLRHGVGVRRRARRPTSSSWPRPTSATTASWPPSSTCSASRASSAAAWPCGTPRARSCAS